jgi:hypothetical protein
MILITWHTHTINHHINNIEINNNSMDKQVYLLQVLPKEEKKYSNTVNKNNKNKIFNKFYHKKLHKFKNFVQL